ncbi:MAG: hypothetical protein ACPK7O_03510 [Methanobacterium sp.]
MFRKRKFLILKIDLDEFYNLNKRAGVLIVVLNEFNENVLSNEFY